MEYRFEIIIENVDDKELDNGKIWKLLLLVYFYFLCCLMGSMCFTIMILFDCVWTNL